MDRKNEPQKSRTKISLELKRNSCSEKKYLTLNLVKTTVQQIVTKRVEYASHPEETPAGLTRRDRASLSHWPSHPLVNKAQNRRLRRKRLRTSRPFSVFSPSSPNSRAASIQFFFSRAGKSSHAGYPLCRRDAEFPQESCVQGPSNHKKINSGMN